ncbi:MAG: amino acid carrier protein [Lachnospiraceae bacterium]|nr:amino acid carrier protein [Lachnospiraceae bacterium]
MEQILNGIGRANDFLWGGPFLLLLMGTHLFFTIRLRFPQKNILKAIKISITPERNGDKQNLSVFATLATTLAATLGTGNIVGVSTAVALGGPGAVFWCWLTGILGMATAYSECFLSMRYRNRGPDGIYRGGPMYVWENGLHNKSMGKTYAFLTLITAFGVGCTTQSNSMAQTTSLSFGISPHIVGFLAAVVAGLVIIGGVKSIGKFCVSLVPALGILFMAACVVLLWIFRDALIPAIKLILELALMPRAAAGGAVGASLMVAARYGIVRGLFTNEAGIGTTAIAAAASDTTDPVRQAYVSMTAVFWDTVVMCLLSGLVIVANMIKNPASILAVNEAGLTDAAFMSLPIFGNAFLTVCLIAFAIVTLIGWSYMGERAAEYLTGPRGVPFYKIGYIVMIYIGAVIPLDVVWQCTDLINALMIPPSVAALFLLHRKIVC